MVTTSVGQRSSNRNVGYLNTAVHWPLSWRTSRQSTRACSWGRRSGSASSWSCCPGLGRRRWCSWGWGRSDGGRRRRRTWHSAGSWRPNLAASLVYKLGDVKPFQHLSDFKSSQMSLYLLVAFCYVLDNCIDLHCISYLHELIWKGTMLYSKLTKRGLIFLSSMFQLL